MLAVRCLVVVSLWSEWATGEEAVNQPKPIPATRVEVKEALERLKFRAPRLPLPEPTEEERAERGGTPLVNNGRMRNLYLPAELRSGGFSRRQDPRMTLDYAFATELFWIVSRVNNCHYCLGHQENKLLAAGLEEAEIAALDCDWRQFSPARQAAYAFTRKLTLTPHGIQDQDVLGLQEHFSEQEALEILFLVSRYNATNRWTDALGIPQESHRTFLTDTAPQFAERPSEVAIEDVPERPRLPDPAEWNKEIASRASRTSLFPLVDEEATRQWLEWPEGSPIPRHAQLLARFPDTGKMWMEYLLAAEEKGNLDRRRRAEIAWTAARHDQAWYAQVMARQRLLGLGYTDDDIFALDDPSRFEAPMASVLHLAQRLTVTPQQITDADLAAVRRHYSPEETAEIVHHITLAAFLNRLTEASRLSWED